MSCHATAQIPDVPQHPSFSPGFKFNREQPEQWKYWFRNLQCGDVFDPSVRGDRGVPAQSTDYSLQLSMGIDNFHDFQEWQKSAGGGYIPGYSELGDDEDVTSEAADEGEIDGSGI